MKRFQDAPPVPLESISWEAVEKSKQNKTKLRHLGPSSAEDTGKAKNELRDTKGSGMEADARMEAKGIGGWDSSGSEDDDNDVSGGDDEDSGDSDGDDDSGSGGGTGKVGDDDDDDDDDDERGDERDEDSDGSVVELEADSVLDFDDKDAGENKSHLIPRSGGAELADGSSDDYDTTDDEKEGREGEQVDHRSGMSDQSILREEMASEANRSLSILSSLLGTASPTTAASTPGTVPEVSRKKRGFVAVERFWGGSDDPNVVEHTSGEIKGESVEAIDDGQNNETTNSEGAPKEGGGGLFVARYDALEKVFHDSKKHNFPTTGWSSKEDAVTLSGFTAIGERETVTQSHSFGFSFPTNPAGEQVRSILFGMVATCSKVHSLCMSYDIAQPFCSVQDQGAPVLARSEIIQIENGSTESPIPFRLELWRGFSEMKELANNYISTVPSSADDWQVRRQLMLREAKRKLRSQRFGDSEEKRQKS